MKKLSFQITKNEKNQALLNDSSNNWAKLTDEQAESLSGGTRGVIFLILGELTAPGGQIETQGKGAANLGLGLGGG